VYNTLNLISAIVKGFRAFSSSFSNFKSHLHQKNQLESHSPVIEPSEEEL
jgi:hypothetical protein